MLLSTVDFVMVSSLGTRAIAAVSILGQPKMVILCVSRSFAVLITAYIAKNSEKDTQRFTEFFKAVPILSIVGALLCISLYMFFVNPSYSLQVQKQNICIRQQNMQIPILISLALSAP